MGKEIYLDPIEFQNVLEKFEKGVNGGYKM